MLFNASHYVFSSFLFKTHLISMIWIEAQRYCYCHCHSWEHAIYSLELCGIFQCTIVLWCQSFNLKLSTAHTSDYLDGSHFKTCTVWTLACNNNYLNISFSFRNWFTILGFMLLLPFIPLCAWAGFENDRSNGTGTKIIALKFKAC